MTRGAQAGTAGQTRITSINGAVPDGQCSYGVNNNTPLKLTHLCGKKSGINGPSLTGQIKLGYGGRRERNCCFCTILVQ
jgi:hypothetical protein